MYIDLVDFEGTGVREDDEPLLSALRVLTKMMISSKVILQVVVVPIILKLFSLLRADETRLMIAIEVLVQFVLVEKVFVAELTEGVDDESVSISGLEVSLEIAGAV